LNAVSAYYYYGRDEQVSGPVELEALAKLLRERHIDEHTPLWSELRDWCALGQALPQFNPPAPADGAPAATGAAFVAPPQPAAEPALESGWHLAPAHPWRRWLARLIDHYSIGVIGYLMLAICVYALSDDIARSEALLTNKLVAGMTVPLLCVPLCALCIGLAGTTPGKWCAGLRVMSRGGGRLGLGRALQRELRVWALGLGLGIPLVSLFCMAIGYSDLSRQQRMGWDEEVGAVVLYREASWRVGLRLAAAALLVAALLAALAGIDAALRTQ
jgi:uncharacterized RDD family membrane protein YckC